MIFVKSTTCVISIFNLANRPQCHYVAIYNKIYTIPMGALGDTYVGAKLDKSLGSNDLEGWGLHLEKVKNIFIVVQDCLPL